MDEQELRDLVIEALGDLKGQEIISLDVTELTSLICHLVIVSGTSSRHVKSLAGNVVSEAKSAGVPVLGIEGESKSDWVLVDLGDVVVHVMLPEARAFCAKRANSSSIFLPRIIIISASSSTMTTI